MASLRTALLVLTLPVFCACASLPTPDGLSANARGMSKHQLQKCMGVARSSSVEANKEYLNYFYRNFYDRYTYQCTVTVELTNDRVSKLLVQGDSTDISDTVPQVCQTVLPSCMR